jgi:hypothetical protein
VTTISLKLPESLAKELELEARRRGVTKSALIRGAVTREVRGARSSRKPSCYDLSRDLCGCLKGGPRDLSTNKKYMEGYGR